MELGETSDVVVVELVSSLSSDSFSSIDSFFSTTKSLISIFSTNSLFSTSFGTFLSVVYVAII